MNIVAQLFQIITLRRHPSDIEYDQFAAIFYVLMSIGLGYITNSLIKTLSQPLAYSIVQGVAQTGFLYGILSLNDKRDRFIQTTTAIFGVSSILGIVTLALSALPGTAILSLFIAGWVLYMIVLIMKESLDCSIGKAVIMAIAFNFLAFVLLMLVFPGFSTEVQSILNAANTEAG